MRKLAMITIGSALLATSACGLYQEYDEPHIPHTLRIPPVDEKFQALTGTLNAINHFSDQSLNESSVDIGESGEKLKWLQENTTYNNVDPFLEGSDNGTGIMEGDPETGGTVVISLSDGENILEGYRQVKGKIQLSNWKAPKAAHKTWEDFVLAGLPTEEVGDELTSADVTVTTKEGTAAGVALNQNFEIQGMCLDTDGAEIEPVTLNYDYFEEITTQADCENEWEGEWNPDVFDDGSNFAACGIPIYNKESCELDPVYGEEIPWHRWLPFIAHCDKEGRADKFECAGKNLTWNSGESKCQNANGDGKKTIRRPASDSECIAAEAAEENGAGATVQAEDGSSATAPPFTWNETKSKCFDNNNDEVAVKLTSSNCESNNGTWQGGTGYCFDSSGAPSYATRKDCVDNSGTWTQIPVLGKLSELVFNDSFELQKDTTGRGFPVFSGIYSGEFTTAVDGGNTYEIKFTDFFYEGNYMEKFDFETGKFAEVFVYTYNGNVTIDGQKYIIKENVVAKFSGSD